MKLRNKLTAIVFVGAMVLTGNAMATPVHTWHTIRALDGNWTGKLQMLNEGGAFVTREKAPLTNFTITSDHAQDYGFIFDAGDDFDVAYTLTLKETKLAAMPQFVSKTCVYVITAKGPAQPDIRVSSFNGAKCDWNVVPGVGEDFTVG